MKRIWLIIFLFSLVYSVVSNNVIKLIDSLFDIPKIAINNIITIGGVIIIYNGLFQIAIDSRLIEKISIILSPVVKKIYKTSNEQLIKLLCSNICANILGLGIASTPIALKAIKENNNEEKQNKEYNFILITLMNTACFTIFPFSIISIRDKYSGMYGIKIAILIMMISFINSLFTIILIKMVKKK